MARYVHGAVVPARARPDAVAGGDPAARTPPRLARRPGSPPPSSPRG
jgi:hypothetical protein